MKLRIYIYLFFLLAINSIYAQVGIGTSAPGATLDIVASNPTGLSTAVDGIVIPRVDRLRAQIMTGTVTSTMIFVNSIANGSAAGTAINITSIGFYYYDGTVWQKIATGNNSDWSLTGNTGTSSATNFLGTTDDVDIVLKRFNMRAGYIGDPYYNASTFDHNNGNTSFGANSLVNPTINIGTQTGVRNSAFGVNSMPALTTGRLNNAFGDFALFSLSSGIQNTAIGSGALYTNSTANNNVAIGRNALTNSNANNNTAVGTSTLLQNSSGTGNTAVGREALRGTTTPSPLGTPSTGNNNTALGYQSSLLNISGGNNVTLGMQSFSANTTGSGNVAIGYQSGALETGSNKLYIANTNADASNALIYGEFDNKIVRVNGKVGVNATPTATLNVAAVNATGATTNVDGILIPRVDRQRAQGMSGTPTGTLVYVNSIATGTAAGTAVNVTAIGFYFYDGSVWQKLAIGTLTQDWTIVGNTNIVDGTNFIGTGASTDVDVAFKRNNAAAGKIGTTSTSFGVGALTAGAATNSTAFGNNALSVSTGSNNVAIGQNALQNSATTAQWNTAVGTSALKGINNAAAQDNVAIGFEAMGLGTGNISNTTAVGSKAMQNSTGGNNTAVGNFALAGAAGIQTGTENVAIGKSSLLQNVSGGSNTAVGSESLAFNGTTSNNVGVGFRALRSGGGNSVAVGVNALISNTGANNTALGYQALGSITTGTGNVAIGNLAGSSETPTSSDKLYIENSSADQNGALIYGDFNTNIVRVNGTLQISNPGSAPGYALPNVRGTNGQVLQTDGAGVTSWANDNNTLSVVRTTLIANQNLGTAGWQKINFDFKVFDLNTEFDISSGVNRFVAKKAGYYEVNAGFHTNSQSNLQFYSIGVYKNNILYQQNSANHTNNGPVVRNVSCTVYLAVNEYVEIFAENYTSGVSIDSFPAKTFFEVIQIR